MFIKPVSITDNPKINQWLTLVEKEMRLTLATLLAKAVEDISQFSGGEMRVSDYIEWVDKYQAQLIVLAAQINWSSNVEDALVNGGGDGLVAVLKIVEDTLTVLADSVLQEQPPVRRKKLENLVSIVCIFLCTLVYSSMYLYILVHSSIF